MGAARRRGSLAVRVAQAQGRDTAQARADYWLNEAKRRAAFASRADMDAMIGRALDARRLAWQASQCR